MISGPRKNLSVLVPLELYQKLQALAQENGRTLSGYTRQILKRYVRFVAEEGYDGWWTVKKESRRPRVFAGPPVFYSGTGVWEPPPAAACSSQGRIGCVSLRRGAQCAPARVGRPACIRFENRHDVEAKSALSRNALAGIPRPLPCFSSPNGTRCAGLPFGGRLRRLVSRGGG